MFHVYTLICNAKIVSATRVNLC